jgi:transcriptional regulator with XRE-family HTH domain
MKFDDDLDMHALAKAIGKRLRAFREQYRLGQRDVAERTGIARESIIRYEKGTLLPSMKSIIVLARFMDITVDELLFGTPEEQIAIRNPFLRKRVLRIERMGADAIKWLLDLMDAFIRTHAAEVDDELEPGTSGR